MLEKSVKLKIGEGNFEQGFPVTLEIREDGAPFPPSLDGKLPPEPQLPLLYKQWQSEYDEFLYAIQIKRLTIKEEKEGKRQRVRPQDFIDGVNTSASKLIKTLNDWLNSETFRPIKDKLLKQLQPNDTVQVIIQTEEPILRRLPWCQWDWFEAYTKAEVAISLPNNDRPSQLVQPKPKVRVLGILGECAHPNTSIPIDTDPDKQFWEKLTDAEPIFLEPPTLTLPELTKKLWDQQGWDILFFAGHSSSNPDATTGGMYVTLNDFLTIPDLKLALKKAIKRGLQLAIFNSCDGLGLAWDLAELHIPQMIVMREPILDKVAQKFLEYFLQAFSRGESLYIAVREAREKLQGLENQYPCASWLPVICQNPTVKPVTWQGFKQAITSSFLADMFPDIYPSISAADWDWFCSVFNNEEFKDIIQQAYRKSLDDVDLYVDRVNQDGKPNQQILQDIASYRRFGNFLTHLSQHKDLPAEIRDRMTDVFKLEKQPNPIIPKPLESYLMITVESDCDRPKEFLVNGWLLMDDSPGEPDFFQFKPILDGNETAAGIICQKNYLPEVFNQLLEKTLYKYLIAEYYQLNIEVFLPMSLMGIAVDQWLIDDPILVKRPLGVRYPIRLRSLERMNHRYLAAYHCSWCQNWDRVRKYLEKNPDPELFDHLQNMENLKSKPLAQQLAEKICLKVTCPIPQDKTEELFKGILMATTPIALWTTYKTEPHSSVSAEIDRILSQPLKNLCKSVQKIRAEADAEENEQHLGGHLSLLWDNPYRLLPDTMEELKKFGQS